MWHTGGMNMPHQHDHQPHDHHQMVRHEHGWTIPLWEVVLACVLGLLLVGSAILSLSFTGWLQLGLGWVLVVWFGRRFHQGAWHGLRMRHLDMDALVTLGTGAALLWSTYAFFAHAGELYFESAGIIIVFLVIGKWIEARQRQKTGEAVQALLKLYPSLVHLKETDSVRDVAVESIVRGQMLLVKSGERIPLDGEVVEGQSSVDASLLTGEAVPVEVRRGSRVFAGTINQKGSFQLRVTQVFGKTVLDSIVRTVQQAIEKKSPVERFVDQVSSIFVPTVIVVAIITFIQWMLFGSGIGEAVKHAVAVLIVACPCALGLATPAAIMVGSGEAAKRGILTKDGSALEAAYRIRTIFFDKTGTLTEGKPSVTDVLPAKGSSEEQVLSMAGGLEASSEHPYALALMREATSRDVGLASVQSFQALPGEGVQGTVQGQTVLVGSATLMERFSIDVPDSLVSAVQSWSEEAKTVLYVAQGQAILGVIALQDRVRSETEEAIRALHALNIKTGLISGDQRNVAQAVAQQVGIEMVFAGVKPNEKAKLIQDQQHGGFKVGFVGDGMNDAPALAQADLGIAMGSGSDVALSTGQIVLVTPSIARVVTALRFARFTFATIRQNLFWAFVYNLVLIPFAAMGFLSPEFAGFAMAASSVSVLGNTLRIRKKMKKL